MSVDLTVTVKDDDGRKLSKTFLVYEPITLQHNDPSIQDYLKETLDEFKGVPDDIKIKATLILQ